MFTNRVVLPSATDESAFTLRFKPNSDVFGMARVVRARRRRRPNWSLHDVTAAVTESAARDALVEVFEGDKPVLVHLHGNSMTPALCFERCTRFEELYGVAVVGFSWPSEGRLATGKRSAAALAASAKEERRMTLADVTPTNRATVSGIFDVMERYRQSKANGQRSAGAIARFLRLVGVAHAAARAAHPFSIAAHSLGAHCLQMVIEAGLGSDLPEARNIALLAPCVPNWRHARWVARLPRSGGLVITTNVSDMVLLGALISDREGKLGASYALEGLVDDPDTRYVDSTRRRPWQHEYFIAERGEKLAKDLRDVFQRFFSSGDDIPPRTNPCDVYRGCCDGVPRVCDVS
jgi:hypothetical protein